MSAIAREQLFEALATAFASDPKVLVSEWAAEERWIASDASPRPGRWSNEYTPYLTEPMDALSFANPCREVVFKKSAQVGATEVGLNWLCSIIAKTPVPCMVALPTVDTARRWTSKKLDKAIEATPTARQAVYRHRSGGGDASTSREKNFRNGSILIVGANSSADMQSMSVRALVCEEVTEYEADVQGMGDPVTALRQRTEAYAKNRKIFFVSTPGIKGSCRISLLYEDSDQAKYYVPCPHCGAFQQLTWARFKWRSEVAPFQAYMVCAACEKDIEQHEKREMVRRGSWIRCYPGTEEDPAPPEAFPAEELDRWEARQAPYLSRGFFIWRVYSPFSGWDDIAKEWLDAKGDAQQEKQFSRQVLGVEYEERHDVPSHEALWRRRDPWLKGRIPPGVLFLTGAADVQGNRLEWAVYGYDRHFGQYWIDGDIIIGDPNGPEVWDKLEEVTRRKYPDAWGNEWPIQSFGVDTGYLSPRVYAWVRRQSHRAEPRILALDGRHGWGRPALGTPKAVDVDYDGKKIGEVLLWPVGTWDIKSDLASALRLTEAGAGADGVWPKGAARFAQDCDLEFFEQMTAEACIEIVVRSGFSKREWTRIRKRNEQWDMAVYARALARHETASFVDATWDQLAAERLGPAERLQADMAALWAPGLAEGLAATAKPEGDQPSLAPPEPEPADASAWGAAPDWGTPGGWS
jgi:phage terminase large subunit GpA-like protein